MNKDKQLKRKLLMYFDERLKHGNKSGYMIISLDGYQSWQIDNCLRVLSRDGLLRYREMRSGRGRYYVPVEVTPTGYEYLKPRPWVPIIKKCSLWVWRLISAAVLIALGYFVNYYLGKQFPSPPK